MFLSTRPLSLQFASSVTVFPATAAVMVLLAGEILPEERDLLEQWRCQSRVSGVLQPTSADHHNRLQDRFGNDLHTIGIGGQVALPPLPHHRTCGSAYGGSAD